MCRTSAATSGENTVGSVPMRRPNRPTLITVSASDPTLPRRPQHSLLDGSRSNALRRSSMFCSVPVQLGQATFRTERFDNILRSPMTAASSRGVSREWGDDATRGTIGRVDGRLGERGCDGCCG
jgi:hypothetical protein